MNNASRILSILKKWPFNPSKKERDFGFYLRQMVKNNYNDKFSTGEDQEVIKEKLDALERLCKNKYGNEYNNYKIGATGLDLSTLNMILTDEYIEKHKKRRLFSW